jgi:hypothetical protein
MKRKLLLAPIGWLVLAACSGRGNSGKLEIEPALIEQVPWINGVPPRHDMAGKTIVPADPVYPEIASGAADPGSRVFDPARSDHSEDCAALDDVVLSGWRHDFEPAPPGTVGIAQAWSTYFDSTEGAWLVPGGANWYPNTLTQLSKNSWGLPGQLIDQTKLGLPQCGDDVPNANVLHVRGGRFNHFGGGVEHALNWDCNALAHQPRGVDDLCVTPQEAAADSTLRPTTESEVMDISGYDGIAFWARRGPEGSSGLMVGLQTKDTSGYLARSGKLGPKYCKREKSCVPTCDPGTECVEFTQTVPTDTTRYRCITPGAAPDSTLAPALVDLLYPQCGVHTCWGASDFPDPDAENPEDLWECKPYTFSGLEENYWCFGSEPPAAPSERCDDGFVSSVSLSTDWQFYKLPFEVFRQAGFAKRADRFDLKNVFSIAFQFSVGYADFYVDNVSFYRNK